MAVVDAEDVPVFVSVVEGVLVTVEVVDAAGVSVAVAEVESVTEGVPVVVLVSVGSADWLGVWLPVFVLELPVMSHKTI